MEGVEEDVFAGIDDDEFFQLLHKDVSEVIPELGVAPPCEGEGVPEESCWGAQLQHHTSACVPGFKIGKGHVSRRTAVAPAEKSIHACLRPC